MTRVLALALILAGALAVLGVDSQTVAAPAGERTEVVVTLAFMPQAIRAYFGDGESLGLDVDYSVEEHPLGTAGSVRLAHQPTMWRA